ncbi:MAG: hypothetical protein RIK87_07865 [Fuerstiella sp.]
MSKNTEGESAEAAAEESDQPPRGSALRWLLGMLILALLTPSLATLCGQHRRLIGLIAPELATGLTFRAGTTHWWSPVQLEGLKLRDAARSAGDSDEPLPLLTIESLSTSQPLWRIVAGMGRGTELTLKKPVLNLRVTDGRTNLEETLEQIFGTSGQDGATMPLAVNIEDGTVRLLATGTESSTGTAAAIDDINGRVSTLTPEHLPEVILTASFRPAGLNQQTARRAPGTAGVNPRVAVALDTISGDHPLLPFTDAEVADLTADTSVNGLRLDIRPLDVPHGGQRCLFEARGLDLGELQPLLARCLPDTDWRGRVSCRLEGFLPAQSDGALAGRGFLQAQNLRMRNRGWVIGESVDIESMTARGAWAMADDGILVNGLSVTSSLLDLNGDGEVRLTRRDPVRVLQDAAADRAPAAQTLVNEAEAATTGRVRLQGRIDLAALSRMIPRTLRIEENVHITKAELRLAAQLNADVVHPPGQLQLSQRPDGFRWQLAAQTSPLQATSGNRTLQVDSSVRVDAAGNMTVSSFSLAQARLSGTFGQLDVAPEQGDYSITGQIRPMELWQQLKTFVNLPPPGFTGDVRLTSRLRLLNDGLHIAQASLQSTDMSVTTPGLKIRPARPLPEMLEGQLAVSGTSAALKTLLMPWHSADWLSDAADVSLQLDADPTRRFHVQAAISPQTSGRPTSMGAVQTGLVVDEGRLTADLVADVRSGVFMVDHANMQLPGLAADISGSISAPAGILVTNLDVQADYDLDVLSRRLLDPSGRKIQFTGRHRETILIRGCPQLLTETQVARQSDVSHAPPDETLIVPLAVTGQVSWDSGLLYGLPLGSGSTRVQLKNGLLRSEPIHCTIGTGELDVMPQWDLNRNLIQLASGSRVRNLNLSPELCREWLAYVTPLLVDAAQVEGSVSARIQRFDYFPDQPAGTSAQGILTVHHAAASPGTSVTPLLQLLELTGKTSLTDRQIQIPSQDIPVDVSGGLVTHDGLLLDLSGYQLASSGSVGLNRQIQLILDIPLERSTVDSRGRSIRVPVGGSIDQPQISTQGLLQNLGRQQLEGELNQQLDRGLNKLLDRLR